MPRENKKGHARCVTLGFVAGTPTGAVQAATPTANLNLLGPLRRVKGKWRGGPQRFAHLRIAVLGGLIGLSACSGPTFRPEASLGTGAVVQETLSLRISVEAEAWRGRPRSLPDYVLPFFISLKNTGSAPLTILRTDFSLLDEANRQYFALAPAEVVTMLGGGASGVGVSPSVGVSGSTAGSTSFGVGLGISLGGRGRDTRDIVAQALPEGLIQPGAEIWGYLYFPHPGPEIKRLRLIASPRNLPGTPRMDFEFRRSAN